GTGPTALLKLTSEEASKMANEPTGGKFNSISRISTQGRCDSVTLTCFCPEERTSVAWFKQTVGQKPQLMAKALRYVPGEFYKEYKNIKRYSLQNAEGNFNLTISNAEPSDSAVYYCAAESYNEINFGNGTFVIITGKYSNSRTVVQQPLSDTVQPGDSVTLQCTIETESCAGEHSVYWFRHGSGESLPGVIYSHGNRSDECEKSPEAGSPTQSCVYSLPKRNLSLSDAGTYYCAVAMCGEMLFGNEYIYFCCGFIAIKTWTYLFCFFNSLYMPVTVPVTVLIFPDLGLTLGLSPACSLFSCLDPSWSRFVFPITVNVLPNKTHLHSPYASPQVVPFLVVTLQIS
uniref:Ig-like domain-containing protein n=1 Tax=Paramormyrops kingsleyae TaxID=1676925 RepID=A0A3B3T0B0_9TELE